MSNNLLDFEENTGPRTCPKCGHQFPLGAFVKRFVLTYGSSKWFCQGCGKLVKCDGSKLQIMLLIGLMISGALFSFLASYFDLGFFNAIFLIPGFVIFLLTFFYVRFE